MLILFAKVTSSLWNSPRYFAGYDVAAIRHALPLLPANAAKCPDDVEIGIELIKLIDIPKDEILFSVGLKKDDQQFVHNRNRRVKEDSVWLTDSNYLIEEFDDEFY